MLGTPSRHFLEIKSICGRRGFGCFPSGHCARVLTNVAHVRLPFIKFHHVDHAEGFAPEHLLRHPGARPAGPAGRPRPRQRSEFVLKNALTSAEAVVQAHQTIALAESDFGAYLAALDAPAKPNAAMKRALKRHAYWMR